MKHAIDVAVFMAAILVVALCAKIIWGSESRPDCILNDSAGVDSLLADGVKVDYRQGEWWLDGEFAGYTPSEDTLGLLCRGFDIPEPGTY